MSIEPFLTAGEEQAKGNIWQNPEPLGGVVERPQVGGNGTEPYDKWQYFTQKTNSAARVPQMRVTAEVSLSCGHVEHVTLQWNGQQLVAEATDPRYADAIQRHDDITRLAKAVGEAVQHGAKAVEARQNETYYGR